MSINIWNSIKPCIKKELNKLNIEKFTEIQNLSLPLTLNGENIIGISPTGTGKTMCYIIPILNNLICNTFLQSIIIVPTRELARQVYSNFNLFKNDQFEFKTTLLIGGEDINKQINNLINTNIIIATPKRFIEIANLNKLNFKYLNSIVLDETDMLFDLGFSNDIFKIFDYFKNIDNIQKMAFSATVHDLLGSNLKQYFKNTKIVSSKNSFNKENITHYLIKSKDKYHSLSVILNQINPYLCLIFTNTKKSSDEIYKYLLTQNRNVINLHGGLKTRERKNNYQNIKKLKFQFVVCSDLASRGLDIDGASHIINWDLPDDLNWYIHRAGRCGRNKYIGYSYILYNDNDNKKIQILFNKGINFKTLLIKDNHLIETKKKIYYKPMINEEQEQEIKSLVIKTKKNIKPGYKKKLKKEIYKIKQKHKRKHIEKLMNENRKKQYYKKEINS